jgi:hypothetical protein
MAAVCGSVGGRPLRAHPSRWRLGKGLVIRFQTRLGVGGLGSGYASVALPTAHLCYAALACLRRSNSRSHPKIWFQLGVVRDASSFSLEPLPQPQPRSAQASEGCRLGLGSSRIRGSPRWRLLWSLIVMNLELGALDGDSKTRCATGDGLVTPRWAESVQWIGSPPVPGKVSNAGPGWHPPCFLSGRSDG